MSAGIQDRLAPGWLRRQPRLPSSLARTPTRIGPLTLPRRILGMSVCVSPAADSRSKHAGSWLNRSRIFQARSLWPSTSGSRSSRSGAAIRGFVIPPACARPGWDDQPGLVLQPHVVSWAAGESRDTCEAFAASEFGGAGPPASTPPRPRRPPGRSRREPGDSARPSRATATSAHPGRSPAPGSSPASARASPGPARLPPAQRT